MVPTSTAISKVASDCINGSCPWLSPQGVTQLIFASRKGCFKISTCVPFPMVHELFQLVFLRWFSGQVSLYKLLKNRFPVSWFYSFPVHIPNWVFKARYLEAYLSFTVSKRWSTWCGLWIPHSSRRKICTFVIPLNCEPLQLEGGFFLGKPVSPPFLLVSLVFF